MSRPRRSQQQARHDTKAARSKNRAQHPRTHWGAVVLVFVVALGARLLYVGQIRELGFFDYPLSDARVFDERAQEIAAGDWLGPADFVHAPLYAYVLGVWQVAFGHDLGTVRLLQAGFGALACVLVLLAGRRYFSSGVGLLAALLLAFYPPALFFDGLIQKTSLALLLGTLLLWLVADPQRDHGRARWTVAGLVFGLLVLTRQNALALMPVPPFWLWFRATDLTFKRWTVLGLLFVAGLSLTLLPWAVRNRVVTGEFVLTTPNLGQNFAMGNHPEATGTYLSFKRGRSTGEHEQAEWVKAAERAEGRSLTPREVSDHYREAALVWIRAHPGAWLRLTGKKLLMTWGAYEAFDTEDYYLYRQWSSLLNVLDRLWHFGVLGPCAIAGMVLTRARWRQLWLLYGWLAITTVAVAVFVVFARYRFPLVPVLVMFAAAGVMEVVGLIRVGRYRALVVPLALAGVATLVCNWPVHLPRRPQPISYTNHATALAGQGRYRESLAEIDRALALDPDNVDAHLSAGNTYLQLLQYAEARPHFERAQAGDPDYVGAWRGLGDALQGLGRIAEAEGHYRRALELDPENTVAMVGLAGSVAQQGRFNEAFTLLNLVLDRDPADTAAHLNLGNLYAILGRAEEAVAAYTRALDHDPTYVNALYNLGLVELQRGRARQAREYLSRALELTPERNDIEAALRAAGGE